MNSDLRVEVILCVDIVEDWVVLVSHHVIQSTTRSRPHVCRANAANSEVDQLVDRLWDGDGRIRLDSSVVQGHDRSRRVSAIVVNIIRLRWSCVLGSLVSHGSETGNNLVTLCVGNMDSVVFLDPVKLDHGGITLTVEDGNALSNLGHNIAAINLVDVHRRLIQANPTGIRIEPR